MPEKEMKIYGSKASCRNYCCFKEEGAAVKKKEDTHRMAEANKAFSHFRFSKKEMAKRDLKLQEISVSWPTLMPVKQPQQSVYFIIPV
jgi:hypothetical protein